MDGTSHVLPDPFLVIATQNPIEYEGTYPLPEAQLDRFLMKIDVRYPSAEDEVAMLGLERDGIRPATLDQVASVVEPGELIGLRRTVSTVTVTDEVIAYIAGVVRATREVGTVELGASPRAAVHLMAVSRALALLDQRDFVTPDDVSRVATPVLRHRILLRPEAELERYRPDDAVKAALSAVPVPR